MNNTTIQSYIGAGDGDYLRVTLRDDQPGAELTVSPSGLLHYPTAEHAERADPSATRTRGTNRERLDALPLHGWSHVDRQIPHAEGGGATLVFANGCRVVVLPHAATLYDRDAMFVDEIILGDDR